MTNNTQFTRKDVERVISGTNIVATRYNNTQLNITDLMKALLTDMDSAVEALGGAVVALDKAHEWFEGNHSDTDFDMDAGLAEADAEVFCTKHSILKIKEQLAKWRAV